MKKLLTTGLVGLLTGSLWATCMGPYCWDDTGGSASMNYLQANRIQTPSTDQFGLTKSSTILPTSTFMTVESTSTALTVVVTATPSISTSTVLGGNIAWPDGTWLILASTATGTARILTLQDEGTLTGSRLHLGASSRQIGPDKILKLIYNAAQNFWDEVSYANNN